MKGLAKPKAPVGRYFAKHEVAKDKAKEAYALSRGQARAKAALEEARRAGLLAGERTEHVSFRVPRALLEAAMQGAGVRSPTELGVAALALAAQTDPVAAYLEETRGRLGTDFKLEY
jgi:hypothetical protein